MELKDLRIINARIIMEDRIIDNGSVTLRDGKILAIEEKVGDLSGLLMPQAVLSSNTNSNTSSIRQEDQYAGKVQIIDACDRYLAPGFIDIHVHGGGDADFMDNDVQAFHTIAALHARHGTTAFTPTTLSCGKQSLADTISFFGLAKDEVHEGADYLGLHIEGPYFAQNMRGAQPARFIHNPDPKEYMPLLDMTEDIIRWSAAPELPGAIELGSLLQSKGILASIAHTDAIYEDVLEAIKAGYHHVTHLYSAMSGVSRKNAFRYAGVIESALLLDELTVEVIADGIHVPPPLLRLVYKVKGADKIALITDAMRGAGMPPGASVLGDRKSGTPVIIEDGVAKLTDRSAFAGSVATTDLLVRNMIQLAGVPLVDAVKMMTITPARIIGVQDKKGRIAPGMDADLVLFDEDIHVTMTMVRGRIVYQETDSKAGSIHGINKQKQPVNRK